MRTDGSDANNGRANNSTGAFATIQKALDVTFGDLDLGGFDVTLQLADGTYAGQGRQVSPQVGAGRVIIRGNASSPEDVIVTSTGSDTAEGTIHMEGAAVVYVEAFEVRAVSRSGLVATRNGIVTVLGGMRFGAVSGQHMQATYGGTINVDGSYAVAGNAAEHWRAAHNSVLRCQNKTVTIVGSLTMTRWARADIGGAMTVNSNTFTGGSVTGQRYQAATNGVVIVGGAGATYLPGSTDGVTSGGGQYL